MSDLEVSKIQLTPNRLHFEVTVENVVYELDFCIVKMVWLNGYIERTRTSEPVFVEVNNNPCQVEIYNFDTKCCPTTLASDAIYEAKQGIKVLSRCMGCNMQLL